MAIAEVGRRHLADALNGKMNYAVVSEWLVDGEPVRIYWQPLTGAEQMKIEAFDNAVQRNCMTVKVRARDADGKLIFADTAIESMINDFDYAVIRAIAFLMVSDFGDDPDRDPIEEIEKE